jgi:hypothetical protein
MQARTTTRLPRLAARGGRGGSRKQSGNTEEDRNRSPKLTSWGCVTGIDSNLLSKLSLPRSRSKTQRSCFQLRPLVGRDWKSLFDLQDFLWCVLSKQALHIGRKFP